MRISDWSSDVCSSDLDAERERTGHPAVAPGAGAPVKAAPAHLAARPAAEDAVPPLEAVHQRPAAAGDRVLRRRADGIDGRGRRLPPGPGDDLPAWHAARRGGRHLAVARKSGVWEKRG